MRLFCRSRTVNDATTPAWFAARAIDRWEQFQLRLNRPERGKSLAVNRTRAALLDRGIMLGSGVSLVLGETVARIHRIELPHETVARDLCEHAGGRN